MKVQTIYVIVLVTYDYYRFQDNLAATTDFAEAQRVAAKSAEKFGFVDRPLPIVSGGASSELDASDTEHIWIENYA